MRAPTAILLVTIVASLPSFARAQARVTRIVGPDGSAIPLTDGVELVQFGSVLPSAVKLDDSLAIGDELRARNDSTIVVLSCSDTAGVTLQGHFRVVIMPRPTGKACFLDLFAGAAHVLGDTSTGLGAGDVMMGAKRTQYTLTISRLGSSVRQDLQVFDGEVEVRSPRDTSTIVSAGTTLAVEGGARTLARITPQQVQTAARLYTVVDVSGLKPDARPAVTESLYDAYQQVLANPDSTMLRLNLIAAQVRTGAVSRATIYQIERVKASALRTSQLPRSQLEATTTALGVAVYTQLGDERKATARYEVLRAYSPQTVDTALRASNLDPEMIRRAGRFDARVTREVLERPKAGAPPSTPDTLHVVADTNPQTIRARPSREVLVRPKLLTPDTLRVFAEASPRTIRVGGRTRIVVKVTTSAEALVPGAKVRVSAGGGAFVEGGTLAEGLTDSAGVFMTVWSCASCAPRYQFSVEVAKAGFVAARVTTIVAVQ